jgi:hypothetical protein
LGTLKAVVWGDFSYKIVSELKPSWIRASIKAWSPALNGGFKHHHCCIHITSCGIKIKSEKITSTNVLKLLMNFMKNCI